MQKELKDVFIAALDDAGFREEFLSDHHAALRRKGWELTAEHVQKLDEFMSGNKITVPRKILDAFCHVAKGTKPPPPPPWEPSIDPDWMPT